ncbi:MAG: phosphatidylserine decarboxylase family protein [Candidatus Marinimicrobia bacterium]|jgi:phosphatidylserine decarboxylase|nr:phosphatidylserine decarboxylase family protein [Candidatus Neomarinimicrobiota bacterium]
MIAKEGYPFILCLLVAAIVLRIIGNISDSTVIMDSAAIPGLLLLFCLNFFRDPKRKIPQEKGIIVSPADGKIVQIKPVEDPEIGKSNLISIFLNVFNVHMNRTPIGGSVNKVQYKKGKFLAAFNHSASDENEQSDISIHSTEGIIKVKQIAGLLARRIRCYVKKGNQINTGDKLGFIMFGSRVDIILPEHIDLRVKLGQKVKGGESIIAKSNETQT